MWVAEVSVVSDAPLMPFDGRTSGSEVHGCRFCSLLNLISDLHSAISAHLSKYESNALITGAVPDPRFRLQWCQQDEIEEDKCSVVNEMQTYAEATNAAVEMESSATTPDHSLSAESQQPAAQQDEAVELCGCSFPTLPA